MQSLHLWSRGNKSLGLIKKKKKKKNIPIRELRALVYPYTYTNKQDLPLSTKCLKDHVSLYVKLKLHQWPITDSLM